MRWYILTGEYPPAPGGVSDYTRQVAEGLVARGEGVTVCAPAGRGGICGREQRGGVNLQWLPGHFGWRGLGVLWTFLNGEPPGGRLLVQYVPHAFGWKAMNVPLCAWLAAQRRQALWIMFHEVAYPLNRGQSWRRDVLARVNHRMARCLATHAKRVLVSTTAWQPLLQKICGNSIKTDCAAIPSNFEMLEPCDALPGFLPSNTNQDPIIGHFGTYAPWISRRLEILIPAMLARFSTARFALMGRGSEAFAARLGQTHPALSTRLFASGELPKSEVPASLMACDVLVQPYADGINTRRTSAMCGLALSRPIITQFGVNSEAIWRESGGVCLVESNDPGHWVEAVHRLLESPSERRDLGRRGGALYREQFSLEKTLDLLLGQTDSAPAQPH